MQFPGKLDTIPDFMVYHQILTHTNFRAKIKNCFSRPCAIEIDRFKIWKRNGKVNNGTCEM